MATVYPDYYEDFQCTAGKCKHNCCIGWEIDIDENTAQYYSSINGFMGEKLKSSISNVPIPHFILNHNERCPFLNNNNLCDIIINLGKDKICTICKEHPRFYNNLDNWTEIGLGLCCEEAARIILNNKEHINLIINGDYDTAPQIVLIRDQVIKILQDDTLPIQDRLNNIQKTFKIGSVSFDMSKWLYFLKGLERLDKGWDNYLDLISEKIHLVDFEEFTAYISDRIYEYEQFCVYIAYRHLLNAQSDLDFIARVKFIFFAFNLIFNISACIFHTNKHFSTEDLIELVRLFSSEIEYSDINLDLILDELIK